MDDLTWTLSGSSVMEFLSKRTPSIADRSFIDLQPEAIANNDESI
jgi:hypothetical protein